MKNFIRIGGAAVLMLFLALSPVQAKFDIPAHVYTVSQLKAAQEKAKNNKKPITFIHSVKATTCGLATAATEDVFQELKDYSVIVFVEPNDIETLPAVAKKALRSPESGRYIPQTVIVNSDMNQVIRILPYAGRSERKKLIKEVQEIISAQ